MFTIGNVFPGILANQVFLNMLVALLAFSTLGQGKPLIAPDADEYRISIQVRLVVLPVVVTDGKGKAVSGLGENSFRVFEDGRPQQIALFEPEDVPVTVGLVIDNSGSMRAKRPMVLAAADGFVKSSNPRDQMFVLNFNRTAALGLPPAVPFTSDGQQLRAAISRSPARGNTALYDGIAAALNHLRTGSANRKALIVISDGGDNSSNLKFHELLSKAEAANAQIYTLGVIDENFAGEDLGVLRRLAKVTGGEAFFPQSAAEIPSICQQIARTLRQQYTLGYHPSDAKLGDKYHAIRVTAKAAGSGKLHVLTRSGYLAPQEAQSTPPAPAKASL